MRAKYKHYALWSGFFGAVLAALALAIVPPFLDLDYLKPKIKAAVLDRTGMHIEISGSVRLSMLGRATITARGISVAENGGFIKAASFTIPYRYLLDIENAPVAKVISIDGASVEIQKLVAPKTNSIIFIRNSEIRFGNTKLSDINGRFKDDGFIGNIRMGARKYSITMENQRFIISNPGEKMEIIGQLATNGSGNLIAAGEMKLQSRDLNSLFGFKYPGLNNMVSMRSDFEWSENVFNLSNMTGAYGASEFSGAISTKDGTVTKVTLVANNIEGEDLSADEFLNFASKTEMDAALGFVSPIKLSLRGGFNPEFMSVMIKSTAANNAIEIEQLLLAGPDAGISARGRISGKTKELDIKYYQSAPEISAHCKYLQTDSGDWSCREFSIAENGGTISGNFAVSGNKASGSVKTTASDLSSIAGLVDKFATDKTTNIKFESQNAAGTVTLYRKGIQEIDYLQKNASIDSAIFKCDGLPKLPNSITSARGEQLAVKKDASICNMNFYGKNMYLTWESNGSFELSHDDMRGLIKSFYPDIKTDFLRPENKITIMGNITGRNISNLKILTGGQAFKGGMSSGSINLETDYLDLDNFTNHLYTKGYDSFQYTLPEPLSVPMQIKDLSFALSAKKIIFGGESFDNFFYSLDQGKQKMSISDTGKGGMILSMDRSGTKYRLLLQLDKFVIKGLVFPKGSNLNISDTVITAQAELLTFGLTAHDFWHNMSGPVDIIANGGVLHEFGTDNFYDSVGKITKINSEYMISNALDFGETRIKSLRLAGEYKGGEFKTTRPLTLSVRHADITGSASYTNGKLAADLEIMMRGISPAPQSIYMRILKSGTREYSLSQITLALDPDYLREFVRTHREF
jgi:hypothetical protein